MGQDPWIHRSSKMRCRTCMWFVVKEADSRPCNPCEVPNELGRCRRHAPTMNGYPAVFEQDWCGDHKIDESKV